MTLPPPKTDTNRRNGSAPDWTPEATDLLISLKRAGAVRGEIVRALKTAGHGDYSPEAVCGKVFRLRRSGVDFSWKPYQPKIPTGSTLYTGAVLGTFLDRLCDVGSW